MPAVVKGWFDRVWGPGIAFDHAPRFGPIHPRLDQLRYVLAITSLGSPWWIDVLIMRRLVRRILKIALLGACARKSRLQFLSFYSCEDVTEERKIKFIRTIEKALKQWGGDTDWSKQADLRP